MSQVALRSLSVTLTLNEHRCGQLKHLENNFNAVCAVSYFSVELYHVSKFSNTRPFITSASLKLKLLKHFLELLHSLHPPLIQHQCFLHLLQLVLRLPLLLIHIPSRSAPLLRLPQPQQVVVALGPTVRGKYGRCGEWGDCRSICRWLGDIHGGETGRRDWWGGADKGGGDQKSEDDLEVDHLPVLVLCKDRGGMGGVLLW
jgi:hypothetical protein